ncbi:MAG: hypothetical protein R3B70_39960 [Polyangiaceae bacterium]
MRPLSPAQRRKKNRRTTVIAWLAVVGLGLLMLIPNAFVCVGTRKSVDCFRTFEAPRGPELPWCGDTMSWFSFPARLPWTVTTATYRAEELRVRIAIGQYQNAIAGQPSRKARELAAERIREAHEIVQTGSKRLAFEELGPAIGAPDPAQDAILLGDRDTLLRRGKDWTEWHQRLHTLRAALLEGDVPQAIDLAKHYATFDPREEDLRSALGALLCLGGDTKRGIELLVHQQDDRASRRYAAMSRAWGDVRTALLACAALGRVPPPPRPTSTSAGSDDRRIARAPLRLRVVEDHDHRLREAQQSTEQLLAGALPEGARAPILAALLASDFELTAERWAQLALAGAREGEPPLLQLGSVNVLAWLDIPADRPIVTGPVYRKAAERLVELASPDDLDDSVRGTLHEAAAALYVEGSRAYVRAADTASSIEMLTRAADLARMNPTTRALAEGILRYATGDLPGAHAVLAKAPTDGATPELLAATLTLRAEVSGHSAPPSKDEAKAAHAAAQKGKNAALLAWSRRILFWADPGSVPPSPVAVGTLDPMAGRFALWPSLGYANATLSWGGDDDLRLPVLERNLAVWSAARFASEADKRAYRYAFLRHRGDMPDSLVPYLAIAAELAGDGGDPEVWLDAVMAPDATRFSLRTYAWARAQAALARGDTASHRLWTDRLHTLATLAGDTDRAELARFLGI